MTRRGKSVLFGLSFLFYGGLVHLFGLRVLVHWAYPPPSNRAFVDHPLTNAGMGLLGGGFVAGFMLRLLRERRRAGSSALATIAKAVVYAVVSTALTLETLCLLSSIGIASWLYVTAWRLGNPASLGATRLQAFLLGLMVSLLNFQAYAVVAMLFSVPLVVAYGVLAGLLILWFERLAI